MALAKGPLAQRRVLGRKSLPFVDRTELLKGFLEWHESLEPDQTGVGVFHGLGGIGKTRLSQRVEEALGSEHPSVRIDFYLPELRGFDSALMAIRRGLGAKLGRGAFPRFDLAYAHYWRLTHPGDAGQAAAIPFLEESEILSDIVTSFSTLPGIGAVVAAAKGAGMAYAWLHRHSMLKEPVVADIPTLDVHEIGIALPEFLGLDLAALPHWKPRPIIFVDTLEALMAGTELVDGESAGSWLEAAIASSHGTTWVITSRDPLGWESGESGDLRLAVLEQQVPPLDGDSTCELAALGGAPTPEVAEQIHALSRGVPFYVELALEYVTRNPDALHSEQWNQRLPQDRLVSRFIGHLPTADRDSLTLMAAVTRFDSRILGSAQQFAGIPSSLSSYAHLSRLTLCRRVDADSLSLEPLVAPFLAARLAAVAPEEYEEFLAQTLAARAGTLSVDQNFAGRQWLVIEALRVASIVGTVAPGLESACEKLAKSPALASAEQALSELVAGVSEESDPYWLAVLTLARLRRRRGAFAQAEALLARKQFPERVRAHAELVLADVRREAGQPRQAFSGYQRVLALTPDGHNHAVRARISIADRQMVLGQYSEALSTLESLARDLEDRPDSVDYSLYLRQRGQLYRVAGTSIGEARRIFEDAERRLLLLGDDYEVARIWTDLADLLCATADPDAAQYAIRAMAVHEHMGETVEFAKSATYLAWARWHAGDAEGLADASQKAAQALSVAHYRSGDDRLTILCAAMAFAAGDAAQAEQLARQAATSVESRDSHRSISLMARLILQRLGVATEEDEQVLSRIHEEITWLPSSELDADGFPLYFHPLLRIPAG